MQKSLYEWNKFNLNMNSLSPRHHHDNIVCFDQKDNSILNQPFSSNMCQEISIQPIISCRPRGWDLHYHYSDSAQLLSK